MRLEAFTLVWVPPARVCRVTYGSGQGRAHCIGRVARIAFLSKAKREARCSSVHKTFTSTPDLTRFNGIIFYKGMRLNEKMVYFFECAFKQLTLNSDQSLKTTDQSNKMN